MKYQINGFLIVEGNADKAFLSSFIDTEIVVLDGYNLKEDTLDYVKTLSKRQNVIILCDPDDAGRKIAKKLLEVLPGAVDIEVKFESRKNYKKTGIAECSKETILKALEPYFCKKKVNQRLTFSWLFSILDTYNISVEVIQEHFHIGKVNKKTTVSRLNALEITEEEIIEFIKNGNQ